ncbi:fatty acid hydroxylase family protein [bacterium]|nr:MAG: fatty acid hydroxylase family protein [bacterium]
MKSIIHFLHDTPVWMLAIGFLLENLLIAGLTVLVGGGLVRIYSARRVTEVAPPLTSLEMRLASTTVLLNSLVTLGGLLLWREGLIQFRAEIGWAMIVDFFVLVIVMDAAMYVLHRLAHIPLFFKMVHRTHHLYDNPRPLTLFVMNPIEALSFGLLWLALLCVYDATWLGMALYLAFNVAFGLIGHIGVEPFPDRWKDIPILKYISTSSFHAGHHQDGAHNFGFYTLIWDRMFGTLEPQDTPLQKF